MYRQHIRVPFVAAAAGPSPGGRPEGDRRVFSLLRDLSAEETLDCWSAVPLCGAARSLRMIKQRLTGMMG